MAKIVRSHVTEEGKPIVTRMRVDDLLLDDENPRLASVVAHASQAELLRTLWNELAVDEVALSIAANGFFEEEPLFVIPARRQTEGRVKYVVVEGNRRLAAVLLLRDEKLRHEIGATDLPRLSREQLKKFDMLPVSTYDTREALWQFFGFRHINGPKPWDAYSKARYVAKVYEEYHVSLDRIADTIGDRY